LGLSPREAEVLQAMMRGRATAAIAGALGVSPRTVSKHAERIYAKLGVHDRVAAVSAAWAALDSGASAIARDPRR
jgi:DNA-binding NarL/FixJ family response regulator